MSKIQPKIGPHSQRHVLMKLDGRGKVARRMRAIRDELVAAVGGPDAISPQQRMLIDGIARRSIRCDMIWQQMLVDPAGVSAEAERRFNWHDNALQRGLKELGLERSSPPTPNLKDYIGGQAA